MTFAKNIGASVLFFCAFLLGCAITGGVLSSAALGFYAAWTGSWPGAALIVWGTACTTLLGVLYLIARLNDGWDSLREILRA